MKVSSFVLAAIVVATTQPSSTLAAIRMPFAQDDVFTTFVNTVIEICILQNDQGIVDDFPFGLKSLDFAADADGTFSVDQLDNPIPFAVTGGEIIPVSGSTYGCVGFRPSQDFIGEASFVYRFTDAEEVDGAVSSNLATAKITVTPIPIGMYLLWLA
jgi:hypothetical protein